MTGMSTDTSSTSLTRTVTVMVPTVHAEATHHHVQSGRVRQTGDDLRDRGPLGPGQGHVREEGMTLQRLDDRGHAVVPADAQVVPLRHVVGEHDARAGTDARQPGQQPPALQRLGLVDDDERVVQAAAPDVGERQDLQQPPRGDLLKDVLVRDRAERVVDRLRPRRHLLGLRTGQVAQVLATHGVQRAEDDDLAVPAPLHHRLQARAQCQRRLARTGPTAQRDDPDRLVEQQVQGDALLGRAAPQAEGLPIAADQPDALVR